MLKPLVITVLVAAALTAATAGAYSSSATAAVPGPCKTAETRAVVFAFARAWTTGNVAEINRLVAPEPNYRWVSAGPPGERSGSRAFDRRSLGAFIRARHARHERLTIKRFKFNGSDLRGEEGFGHFEFKAIRLSDDQASDVGLRSGKGAIICTLARPMIAVWSLG